MVTMRAMSEPPPSDPSARHEAFRAMVERIRPELLRYCARMMGSTLEGEDVVQETLAHAFQQLPRLRELPSLRAWLFRSAHNRAINALVVRERRAGARDLEDLDELPADDLVPDAAIELAEAVDLAIDRFTGLVPAQRACVILKDVLDESLVDIAAMLDLSVTAVKAALHRGRVRLRELGEARVLVTRREHTPEIMRYSQLFNARDWDGVRAMLARDVRLEVMARETREGAEKVGVYYTNYDRLADWHLAPAWMDGREVLAVFRDAADVRPQYVMELTIRAGEVAVIRDFRYASWVVDEASIERASPS
jgi:RNA polymerase sigma factor (sigma-70 family)